MCWLIETIVLIAMKVRCAISGNCNTCELVNQPPREWCLDRAYTMYIILLNVSKMIILRLQIHQRRVSLTKFTDLLLLINLVRDNCYRESLCQTLLKMVCLF